ncbi:uncharacterized protein LOC129807853 [Phlebotomus papatasi]|uniref:uncharacterized protein LOC129807853 n=1 Tax=Phlebotomus papatasi TaxID=29031 RepID=UPI002484119E|nr:uncharacterized protein LOC129807853 [Phlebotomus papatasi]
MRLVLLIFGLLASTHAASLGDFAEVAPENNNAILDEVVTRWLRGVIADFADPHFVDFRDVDGFDFGNSLVTLDGYLRGVQIRGLNDIVVNRISLDWQNLRFDFDITVPHLSLSGNWYDLRGRFVGILPIFGHGPFTIDFWNLNVNGHAILGQRHTGTLEMRSFRTRSRLQRFQTNFHNLLFGGEFGDLWNHIFSDMLPAIMENFHPEVTNVVENTVIPIFNERLNDVTRDDLWDIIHGNRNEGNHFIESLVGKVFNLLIETETEKPEPYFARTSMEPYAGFSDPEPSLEPYARAETEKPEPYFARTSMEPYAGFSDPEPSLEPYARAETEKPEPYFARTSMEPYAGFSDPEPSLEPYARAETEKPEPYFARAETEKPEPYFARTSMEPYAGFSDPEPSLEPYARAETEKPEPYFARTSMEPYAGFSDPEPSLEPYARAETEKPEPYFARTSMEPYAGFSDPEPSLEPYARAETEKPEPYFARTSMEPYEVNSESPEPYKFAPEIENVPVIRIPLGNTAWITSINVKSRN